ncbi:MAG TPA: hypothetical protein VMT43_09725 [Acidimicrobiales bacterium]|nr:hypothetical protein [Acidimicrobiales bacterium]
MSVDDRIRGALAELAPAPADDLDRLTRAEKNVRAHIARRRRARRGVALGLVIVVAGALVTGLVWRGSASKTLRTAATSASTTTPLPPNGAGHLLAIRDGALVELSATSGALERTLVPPNDRPVVAMAASGDGRVAYVARPPVARRFADAFAVERVDLQTGHIRSIVRSEPTPVGVQVGGVMGEQNVALATDRHGTRVVWSARFGPVTVLDVTTGRRTTWVPPGVTAPSVTHQGGVTKITPGGSAVSRLLWSPDDRHLAVSVEGESFPVWILDFGHPTSTAERVPYLSVELVPGMSAALAYVPATGDLIGRPSCTNCLPTFVQWSGTGRPTTFLVPGADPQDLVVGRDARHLYFLNTACDMCLVFVGYDVTAGDGVHLRPLLDTNRDAVDALAWIP